MLLFFVNEEVAFQIDEWLGEKNVGIPGRQCPSLLVLLFPCLAQKLEVKTYAKSRESTSQWNVFLAHEESLPMENLISFEIAREDSGNYIFQEEIVWCSHISCRYPVQGKAQGLLCSQ